MSKRKPRTKQVQDFVDENPHLSDFVDFIEELNDESERGTALIANAMIDDLLLQCIRAFLIQHKLTDRLLKGFNAPLGTYSARTVAAFSMGLISEDELREITTLREIRNVFAHNVHCTFTQQNISDLCANLKFCIP